MPNRVSSEARNIRKLVREAEAVTDEAILAYAKLKQSMIAARTNPDIQVGTGQAALLRLVGAEQKITAASSELFRVHAALNTVATTTAGVDDDIPTEMGPEGQAGAAQPGAELQDAA